ncbi:hypothetical protein J437_LFUL010771 [Ladona fulva]|uniref:Uncharacterized protein n=1 Tax=Ladona fulva TaxID=123851 RepID=A0A8K0K729_LADFU|nr:hypothetical protein J437_LFUL010771 [Ladona fulva]
MNNRRGSKRPMKFPYRGERFRRKTWSSQWRKEMSRRSIGIVPAITSTAASETVRYEQATLRAPLLCTTVMLFLYFAVFRALAHISTPYRSCDSTTAINSFLLHCFGLPTFAISLLNDTVVAAALSEEFLI